MHGQAMKLWLIHVKNPSYSTYQRGGAVAATRRVHMVLESTVKYMRGLDFCDVLTYIVQIDVWSFFLSH